jgi:hypothetical protein
MAEALRAHARALAGPQARLVGPFLCPMARIDELDACVASGVPRPPELAVIGARDEPRWRRIAHRPGVVQVEAPHGVPMPDGAPRVRRYVELPSYGPLDAVLDQIAASAAGTGVKVRCGGMTPDAVPTVERLADVLVGCARRRLPLKATAGLHHPFRHRGGPRPETNGVSATKLVKAGKAAKAAAKAAAKTAKAAKSGKGGPAGNGTAGAEASAGAGGGGGAASTMAQHGFVNLLAAAAAAVNEAGRDELVQILDTEEHDGGQVLLGRLDRKSRTLLRSIGSCSIDEPAEGLAALGLL